MTILEFREHGGVEHFEISDGKRGWVKMFMLSVIGYGYFLESPILGQLLHPNIVIVQ